MNISTGFLVGQLTLIATVTFGADKPEFKSRKNASGPACVQRIYPVLDRWEVPERWVIKEAGPIFELESKTNSKNIILNLRHSSDFSELTRTSPHGKRTLRFEAPKCDLKFKLTTTHPYKVKNLVFTDHELSALLGSSQVSRTKGIIYIWSPNMNLSVRGVVEAAELAKNRNLGFVALLDPYADTSTSEQVAQAHRFPREFLTRLESSELIGQDALTHFPALFIYSNGALLNTTRLGYDEKERLRTYIEDKLK